MKRLSVLALIGLSACGGSDGDWRATAIVDAERQIREQVSDPAAEFSRVQFTGDQQTGQTCGHVDAASGGVARDMGRFIVFIDGSAPLVEGGIGKTFTSKENFDWQWLNQCANLGYHS